jgi:hypothetical protein
MKRRIFWFSTGVIVLVVVAVAMWSVVRARLHYDDTSVTGLLVRMLRGDAGARDRLIGVANDPSRDIVERTMAVDYLAKNTNDVEAIVAALKMLLSEEPALRTRAYYSLPQELRPRNYDKSMPPSDASRTVVEEIIERVKRERKK